MRRARDYLLDQGIDRLGRMLSADHHGEDAVEKPLENLPEIVAALEACGAKDLAAEVFSAELLMWTKGMVGREHTEEAEKPRNSSGS